MKKKILVISLLLLLLSPLYSFSFFYSIGGEGEGLDGESHYAGMNFDVGLSFFNEPYLMADASLVLSPLFESVSMNISSEPFSVPVHMYFLFANPVLYSPKIKVGAEYVYQDGWYYRAEVALLNFRDKSFEYEFLTPMLTVDAEDYSLGYGIRIMEFTYFM